MSVTKPEYDSVERAKGEIREVCIDCQPHLLENPAILGKKVSEWWPVKMKCELCKQQSCLRARFVYS